MEAIILGNPYDIDLGSTTPIVVPAYTAEEAVIELADGYNPYIIGGSSGSVDQFWFRYNTGILKPLITSDKVIIGGTSLINTEIFRVVGKGNFTSIQLGASTTISSILDEDDMISNSNTAIPTQQSVKAYVDASILSGGLHVGDNISLLTNDSGYITTETDPIFVASDVYSVVTNDINNWNTAFSWGDHSIVGYLTVETDPIFIASDAYSITSADIVNWNDAYSKEHSHNNFGLLETIISSGLGTKALLDDGTYGTVIKTVGGSNYQIQYNVGGVLTANSNLTIDTVNNRLSTVEAIVTDTLYIGNTSTSIILDASDNLLFTDVITGSKTLADLISGATNYWTSTTGGIYYSNYISNHINPNAELDITGHILADNFDSNFFRYKNSNLLLGPNAGDNETDNYKLYIADSNTATPLILGDFTNQMVTFNADVYINTIKRLNFGSSDIYIRRDASDNLIFRDLNANSGAEITLTDLTTLTGYALKSDFTSYTSVTTITAANKITWNKASVIVDSGSGDSYLANDGTYKVISGGGNITTLYLHVEASDIGTYEKLLNFPSNDAEVIETGVVTSGTSPVLMDSHVTEPSYPGITTIPAGVWAFKTWASVDNATGTTTITIRVYQRATDTTETELFNVTTTEINSLTPLAYVIETVQPEFTIDATDRIVIKYYTSTSTGTSITTSLYYEGTNHYSYITTPLSFSTTIINDYTWKWDTSASYLRPYTNKTEAGGASSAGKFYNSTDTPTATNVLTYDGAFRASSIFGTSGSLTPIQGTSTNASYPALIGINTSTGVGLFGSSDSGIGFLATSIIGVAGIVEHSGALTSDATSSVLKINRYVSGAYDTTGNLLEINDAPTSTEIVSGALVSGNVDGTEVLRLDPRSTTLTYKFDTATTLTSGSIVKFYNNTSSVLDTQYDGNTTLGTIGVIAGSLSLAGATSGKATLKVSAVAGTPILTLPVTTGTLALTSDIVTPIDDIFDWSTNKYKPYAAKQVFLSFDTDSVNPTLYDRLNLNGFLYTSNLHVVGSAATYPSLRVDCSVSGQDSIEGRHTGGNAGIAGYSNTGPAGTFYSNTGSAISLYQGGSDTTSNPVVDIERTNTGTTNVTGDIIRIIDNPSTSGTISGKVLSATIETTERLCFNPRETNGAGNCPYIFDTHNNLTTATYLTQWFNQGVLKNYVNSSGKVGFAIGSSSTFALVPGIIKDFYTDASTSGTGETDLYSYTIPANVLGYNGDKLLFEVYLDCTSIPTLSTIKVYFAGTSNTLVNLVTLDGVDKVNISIIRVSSSVCRIAIEDTLSSSLYGVVYAELTSKDWTTTNVLKITGQCATNSIVAKFGYIEYKPAGLN